MKLVSIDGHMASGKTTLASLLADHFPNSAAIIYSKEEDDEKYALFDSVKLFRSNMYSMRRVIQDVFDRYEYNKQYMEECSFAVSMIRLMMIEASYELQSLDYVFVDTFWDPIWWYTSKTMPGFVERLKEKVKIPDISFYIRANGSRLHPYRVARDRDRVVKEDEEFYKNADRRMHTFLQYAEENITNFHTLDRTAIPDVFRKATTIIKER